MAMLRNNCLKMRYFCFEPRKHTRIIFVTLAKIFRVMTNSDAYYKVEERQSTIPLISVTRRLYVKERV